MNTRVRKDGLPYLGAIVEVYDFANEEWVRVKVIAHHGGTFGIEWPDGWREPLGPNAKWRPVGFVLKDL